MPGVQERHNYSIGLVGIFFGYMGFNSIFIIMDFIHLGRLYNLKYCQNSSKIKDEIEPVEVAEK